MTTTDATEGVIPMTLPRQLTRQEVDELYVLTALLAPYTSEKKS